MPLLFHIEPYDNRTYIFVRAHPGSRKIKAGVLWHGCTAADVYVKWKKVPLPLRQRAIEALADPTNGWTFSWGSDE